MEDKFKKMIDYKYLNQIYETSSKFMKGLKFKGLDLYKEKKTLISRKENLEEEYELDKPDCVKDSTNKRNKRNNK